MDLWDCAADAQSKNCRHGGGDCQKIGKKLSTSFMDYCLIRSLSCTLFSKQFCKFGNKISPTYLGRFKVMLKYVIVCRYLSNEIGMYNKQSRWHFRHVHVHKTQFFTSRLSSQLVLLACPHANVLCGGENTLKYFFQVCQFALLTFKTQSTISSRNMSQILEHYKHIGSGNNCKWKLILKF